MGGKIGRFGLGISPDLETLDYHEDVKTFDLPALPGGSSFEIGKKYALKYYYTQISILLTFLFTL